MQKRSLTIETIDYLYISINNSRVPATCKDNIHEITRLHYVGISSSRSGIRSNNRYDKQGVCQARIHVHGYQSARLVSWWCWWQPVWRASAARVGTYAHIPILVAPAAASSNSESRSRSADGRSRPIRCRIEGRPPVLT